MTQTDLRPALDETPAPHVCDGGCGRSGITRRTAIGVGIVAGAAMITACGSSDTPTTTSSSSSAPASTSAATSSSASSAATSSSSAVESSSSSAPSSSSSAASSASAPAGAEIAKLADVPDGGSLIVASNGDQIALAKNADGTVVAHTAICTHQGCTVKADGATLTCPCHGSQYDAFTGAVTKSPAPTALAAIAVEVSGDGIYLSA